MWRIVWIWIFCSVAAVAHADAYDTPLNRWSPACGAGPEAVEKTKSGWTFRPGPDGCGAGDMRSEVQSEPVPADTRGAYLMQVAVSLDTDAGMPFTLFRVDGDAAGCAAPLELQVDRGGRLEILKGSGKSCGLLEPHGSGSAKIFGDGVTRKLDILMIFDGHGGFKADLRLDGRKFGSATFVARHSGAAGALSFALGVQAAKQFDFTMSTEGPTARSMSGKI